MTPTNLELREELLSLVRADLLGPADGPEEEILEQRVNGRYILGLLAPKGELSNPEELDELAAGGADGAEDTPPDSAMPKNPSIMPSSIGMTFSVDGNVSAINCSATWGRYERTKSDYEETEQGNPKTVWKRRPAGGGPKAIALAEGKLARWVPDPEIPDVYVQGLCRRRDDAWMVTLFLVNGQTPPEESRDQAWVFQPKLVVKALDSAPVFIKRPLPPGLAEVPEEDLAMEMLYRRSVEFAVGHGAAVHVETLKPSWDRAVSVETRIMPTHEVELMNPPTEQDLPALAALELDMKRLAAAQQGEFAGLLNPLIDAYEQWIAEREKQLQDQADELRPYDAVTYTAIDACREALLRIREGIDLLDADSTAARAFTFANEAMYLQRVRSIYAQQARQGMDPDLSEIEVPRNHSWRPFQLAFVLLNLKSLVDPSDDSRNELADLLWFPTGGGKTEAYLGVAAVALAARRLQGDLGGMSGQAGVTVLMRYTLRLLTLQQFQRATTLIAACETIRKKVPDTWGLEPFRIGLWVGQKSTPNRTQDSAEAIRNAHGDSFSRGGGTPAQLTNCPWCGSEIKPDQHIVVEEYKSGRCRTIQYCGDKMGRCPFTKKRAPGEGLPILVVDEEIYRQLPSLLIATVDKFAQMPWKGETQMLFGRVNGRCERHGFRSPEVHDSDSHPANATYGLPAAKTRPAGPFRPPDLIIQDELHLISGPLGTLVGLYETAVDELCSWDLDGTRVRPKVIASTATVRRAQQQVHGLFERQVKIFPPPGLDAEDNFFARRQPSTNQSPGRLYVGVCAPGIRLKSVLIRVYVAYMAAAQQLFEEHGERTDPWMTLVGYFNAMRELGGMRRMVDDDVRERLRNMERRGLAQRSIYTGSVEELTSRKSASDIPKILDKLETTFEPLVEGTKRTRYPLDVLLATNMISVGVDVGRLGLMVTAGQPKATAEYIQATSRVGRQHPGLVCTVFNWSRPRDLSHYERFEHYHATFYRQVEALSVTPFAPRALDRGLAGVAVALVRLLETEMNANEKAGAFKTTSELAKRAMEVIIGRADAVSGEAAITHDVEEKLKQLFDDWARKASEGQGANLGYKEAKDGTTLGLLLQPSDRDWERFTCLNSLRDVEPQVGLVLKDLAAENEPEWQWAPQKAKEVRA